MKIDKNVLYELYTLQKLTPSKIARKFKCNHKTIRSWLKKYNIAMRSPAEYNYLARPTHISPTDLLLFSDISIAGHIAYLCEGWHTNKTTQLYFCNTDPILINLFCKMLFTIYSINHIRYIIISPTLELSTKFKTLYPSAKIYIEPLRKNPIIRIYAGGKTLAKEFINNAYKISSSLS
ncbi:MAG TPA: helix-turn-helix domain-containing protein [Bacteroidales bacterium]|nr:helix-turn-helix domain-containing protein [Bacteroidales bacterium]